MSSTQNPNLQQPYELYVPQMEIKDTEDAHILLVQLPDFTRQQVGAYYEAAHRRIRVFGEKPIENNKRKRFSEVHTIPEDCDADNLKGEFEEGAKITFTIPKKPKEPEPEPAQEQEAAKQTQITTPPPSAPNSASEVEPEAAAVENGEKGASEEKPKPEMEGVQIESDDKKYEKPTPPEPEVDEDSIMPQKDTTQDDQKSYGDEKMKESTEDSASTTEKEKGSESGIPQKDQDQEVKGIPQEDEKKTSRSEEGKASLQKDQLLTREKSKELERKESDLFIANVSPGLKKTPEMEKEPSFKKDQSLEREKRKEEIKESAMDIADKSSDIGLKKTSEKKEKQMGVQTVKVSEEWSQGNTVSESSSIGKGFKYMTNSASQAVTRLANRFSEEDKQKKLLCAGAAILVVAVGIYASFKLRSMTRQ